jgi:hypothetical protein
MLLHCGNLRKGFVHEKKFAAFGIPYHFWPSHNADML